MESLPLHAHYKRAAMWNQEGDRSWGKMLSLLIWGNDWMPRCEFSGECVALWTVQYIWIKFAVNQLTFNMLYSSVNFWLTFFFVIQPTLFVLYCETLDKISYNSAHLTELHCQTLDQLCCQPGKLTVPVLYWQLLNPICFESGHLTCVVKPWIIFAVNQPTLLVLSNSG